MADHSGTREFFGPRAAGWDDRFPDDGPAYAAAVEALALQPGGTALDAACGTGRAVPILQTAVGPRGRVIGVDLTPEMLQVAAAKGRGGTLVRADVLHLPLPSASVDAVLAAGLLPHLRDASAGLAELARVARPGARLGLFHPIGRAALAARHGGRPDPDDVRSTHVITRLLAGWGWEPESVDDGPDRYLVVARRAAPTGRTA